MDEAIRVLNLHPWDGVLVLGGVLIGVLIARWTRA